MTETITQAAIKAARTVSKAITDVADLADISAR